MKPQKHTTPTSKHNVDVLPFTSTLHGMTIKEFYILPCAKVWQPCYYMWMKKTYAEETLEKSKQGFMNALSGLTVSSNSGAIIIPWPLQITVSWVNSVQFSVTENSTTDADRFWQCPLGKVASLQHIYRSVQGYTQAYRDVQQHLSTHQVLHFPAHVNKAVISLFSVLCLSQLLNKLLRKIYS